MLVPITASVTLLPTIAPLPASLSPTTVEPTASPSLTPLPTSAPSTSTLTQTQTVQPTVTYQIPLGRALRSSARPLLQERLLRHSRPIPRALPRRQMQQLDRNAITVNFTVGSQTAEEAQALGEYIPESVSSGELEVALRSAGMMSGVPTVTTEPVAEVALHVLVRLSDADARIAEQVEAILQDSIQTGDMSTALEVQGVRHDVVWVPATSPPPGSTVSPPTGDSAGANTTVHDVGTTRKKIGVWKWLRGLLVGGVITSAPLAVMLWRRRTKKLQEVPAASSAAADVSRHSFCKSGGHNLESVTGSGMGPMSTSPGTKDVSWQGFTASSHTFGKECTGGSSASRRAVGTDITPVTSIGRATLTSDVRHCTLAFTSSRELRLGGLTCGSLRGESLLHARRAPRAKELISRQPRSTSGTSMPTSLAPAALPSLCTFAARSTAITGGGQPDHLTGHAGAACLPPPHWQTWGWVQSAFGQPDHLTGHAIAACLPPPHWQTLAWVQIGLRAAFLLVEVPAEVALNPRCRRRRLGTHLHPSSLRCLRVSNRPH
ncbi:hypothetical protein CYMTET_31272 [Cymbomonas tetramitiformis]|uniref:Uncharacterized protein n=1 Tax=Cymbomonas tetramitiformis TaxID=36881 RepID=A0AAE0KTB1_9CHLO|nr:hypothetical protein CYMTET_31272 [Cymbomonas tetramitiformis]